MGLRRRTRAVTLDFRGQCLRCQHLRHFAIAERNQPLLRQLRSPRAHRQQINCTVARHRADRILHHLCQAIDKLVHLIIRRPWRILPHSPRQPILLAKLNEIFPPVVLKRVRPKTGAKNSHSIRILMTRHMPGEQPLQRPQCHAIHHVLARQQPQVIVLPKHKPPLGPVQHFARHEYPVLAFPHHLMHAIPTKHRLRHIPNHIRPPHPIGRAMRHQLLTQRQRTQIRRRFATGLQPPLIPQQPRTHRTQLTDNVRIARQRIEHLMRLTQLAQHRVRVRQERQHPIVIGIARPRRDLPRQRPPATGFLDIR